jgi:hypothetical protein
MEDDAVVVVVEGEEDEIVDGLRALIGSSAMTSSPIDVDIVAV